MYKPNKLFRNKKAMMFSIFLVIIGFIALYKIYGEYKGKQVLFEGVTGDAQVTLLNTYSEAEKALFYLDQSAKYAGYQALHVLAARGGFELEPRCGSVDGYMKLVDKSNTCYYEDIEPIKENLKSYFDKYLLEYLHEYPAIEFPEDYEYVVESSNGLNITGEPGSQLKLNIADFGTYSVKPSFKINVAYNLAEYGIIIAQAKKINNECNVLPTNRLLFCVESISNNAALDWVVDYPGDRTFKFGVTGNKRLPYFDGASNSLKPVTIRFAVTLPDNSSKENIAEENGK